MTSRLKQRRWSGIAHGLLFCGALILIFGHAVFALSFVGVPVYAGWFGFLVMELGREIAGIMVFLGVLFFLLRRFFPPERLVVGRTRQGFERMEALILLIVVAGYCSESFRLALQPGSGGEFLGTALSAALGKQLDPDALLFGFKLLWWLHGLLGVTFIVVTHDQEEAMTLASRIGVMNRGEIVQIGTPTEIYEFPATRFVADFIGSVNMFEGRLIEDLLPALGSEDEWLFGQARTLMQTLQGPAVDIQALNAKIALIVARQSVLYSCSITECVDQVRNESHAIIAAAGNRFRLTVEGYSRPALCRVHGVLLS